MRHFRLLAVMLFIIIAGCTPLSPLPQPPQEPTLALPTQALPTVTGAPAEAGSPTAGPTGSPTATAGPMPTPTLAPLAEADRLKIFETVWKSINEGYIDPSFGGLDWQAVKREYEPRIKTAPIEEFYRLISEMVDRLNDTGTFFLSSAELSERERRLKQTPTGGIGIMSMPWSEGLMVYRVGVGGAGARAGIRPGDQIISADGKPITNTLEVGSAISTQLLRGEPGTELRLGLRLPDGALRNITLIRQELTDNAFLDVESRYLPGTATALLKIYDFGVADITQQIRRHLNNLIVTGPPKQLIIDLRDADGGRLMSLTETLSLFVDQGVIGRLVSRKGKEDLALPNGKALHELKDLPLVVLVGPGTAGMPEYFAAGVRELKRGKLVGMGTPGSTGLLASLEVDKSLLFMVVQVFELLSGERIEGKGLTPDLRIQRDMRPVPVEQDRQIQAALDLLR